MKACKTVVLEATVVEEAFAENRICLLIFNTNSKMILRFLAFVQTCEDSGPRVFAKPYWYLPKCCVFLKKCQVLRLFPGP